MPDERIEPIQLFEKDKVIMALPTTYLRAFMRFELNYRFDMEPGYVNHVSIPVITLYYSGSGADGARQVEKLDLVVDNKILFNMNRVTRYMQYAYEHLRVKNEKSIPKTFEEFEASE